MKTSHLILLGVLAFAAFGGGSARADQGITPTKVKANKTAAKTAAAKKKNVGTKLAKATTTKKKKK